MDQVQEIKSKLDVVEVVREYLPNLKQVGSNWKTLCPFHNEKTPSFMVSPERQIWHCFGCGEGGDIFEFVKKIENVEFPEALRILAQRAGIVLKKRDPKLLDQRTKQLELQEDAAKFFQAHLWQTKAGGQAKEYLLKRGLKEETIKQWRLGFAPDSYDALNKYLRERSYTDLEIKKSGLVVLKDNNFNYYDRFRGRLMFPLFDAQGQIVAFTGRLLKEESGQGKYINSPQTILYNKSYLLYGLHAAKEEIKNKGRVLVVEGQMDVLSVHQAGEANVVASSGTALTSEQLELLKRYTNTLLLAFDADQAGAKAIERATDLALRQGFKIQILLMPAGEDPDTLVQKDRRRWQELVASAPELMEYFFSLVLDKSDLGILTERKEAAHKLLTLISKLPDAIDRDYYLKKLSERLNISEAALREVLANFSDKNVKTSKKEDSPFQLIDIKQKTSQRIIAWLLARNDFWSSAIDQLLPEMIEGQVERNLYSNLIAYYTNNNSVWDPDSIKIDNLQQVVAADFQSRQLLDTLYVLSQDLVSRMDNAQANADFQLLCHNLQKQYYHSRLNLLKTDLVKAEADNDQELVEKLTLEINQLINRLAQLN